MCWISSQTVRSTLGSIPAIPKGTQSSASSPVSPHPLQFHYLVKETHRPKSRIRNPPRNVAYPFFVDVTLNHGRLVVCPQRRVCIAFPATQRHQRQQNAQSFADVMADSCFYVSPLYWFEFSGSGYREANK